MRTPPVLRIRTASARIADKMFFQKPIAAPFVATQTRDGMELDNIAARGIQLLSGDGDLFDPQAGVGMLMQSAEAGHARACACMAAIAAAGVCQAQSWQASLDWLQRAADLGWRPAQAQLMLLSANHEQAGRSAIGPGDLGAPKRDWSLWRKTIDIAAWLSTPDKEILSEAPRVRLYREFLPPSMCRWLIDRARDKLRRASTYDPLTGMGAIGNARTNSETDFNIVESDLPLLLVRARIAEATGLPTAIMELSKVLHYAHGQQFGAHFDFIDPVTPALAAEVRERGQRMATFLIYLNDEYDGGETDFPQIGLRHRGQAGDALFFANVDTNGVPDPLTLHAGLAPTRSEKWLLSQWIRDQVQTGRK